MPLVILWGVKTDCSLLESDGFAVNAKLAMCTANRHLHSHGRQAERSSHRNGTDWLIALLVNRKYAAPRRAARIYPSLGNAFSDCVGRNVCQHIIGMLLWQRLRAVHQLSNSVRRTHFCVLLLLLMMLNYKWNVSMAV